MSYRECPACGKRALSIATRCPQCGEELPRQPIRWQASRQPSRLRPLLVIALVLVATVGLGTLLVRREATRDSVTSAAVAPAGSPNPLESAGAVAPAAVPDSAPSPDAVPRRARTWTKVHDRRSVKADVVAILLPGDTVLADSLKRGWWRVALEGRVLGYVYAPTLTGD